MLLGLGADGHTASLFPRSPALDVDTADTAANWVDSLGEWRLTLTYGVVNASYDSLFLISGSDKQAAVKRVFADHDPAMPAARVIPRRNLYVYLDQAAAGHLRY